MTSFDAIERACARAERFCFPFVRTTPRRSPSGYRARQRHAQAKAFRAVLLGACVSVLAGCTTLPPARPIASPAASPSASAAGDARGDAARDDAARGAASLPDGPSTAASGGSNEASPERGVDGGRAASNVLLERSRAAREAGRYDTAAASIERALRITPNDPSLWLELAEIKLAAGDSQQAAIMARKAASLADGDRSISARAERLIDTAGR